MNVNRNLLLNGLMVGVVAPYLYKIADKEDVYFKLGLKMLAGTIAIVNLPPLIEEVKPLYQAAQMIKQQAEEKAKVQAEKTIDGEVS